MLSPKDSFIQSIRHPVKSRLFLLLKLPSAFFSGVRIRTIDVTRCEVSVPYKWFTKNPFRSTYFACLSMAAELSTGALAMSNIYGRKVGLSMLVVKIESEYFKKATGRTVFTCEDGRIFEQAIAQSITTGEAKIVRAKSIGKNAEGDTIAEFFVSWSFKARK
jgi:hypothetical protein